VGFLIFLVLLGLVVALWRFILVGAAYLIYYPPLLALALFIFPATRGWGVALFVIWLIYFGIKESVKDSQGKKLFVATATEAGYSRKEINKLIRTKKSNESWQDCISQLNTKTTSIASSAPTQVIAEEAPATPELDIEKALKFIGTDFSKAIAVKYALENKTHLNGYGLTHFANDKFNTTISGGQYTLESVSNFILAGFIKRVSGNYYDNDESSEFELAVSASDDAMKTIDDKLEELRQAILKGQVKEYKDIVTQHKEVVDKYIATFVKLSQKVIKHPDKWGDIDNFKINELKCECIYKIYKAINSEQYKEKSTASFPDYQIRNALNNVTAKPKIGSATPYWVKHLYDIDLPKALKAKHATD
jgi:hypothetical protein